MLRKLVRHYAIHAREFSDAVASLARYDRIGPEFLHLIEEIKTRHRLCDLLEEELDQYIQEGQLSEHAALRDDRAGELQKDKSRPNR